MSLPRILTAHLGNEIDELLHLEDLPESGQLAAYLAGTPTPGAPVLHPSLRLRASREDGGVRVTLSEQDLARGVSASGLQPGLLYLHVRVPGRYHVAIRLRLRAARVL